jgi:hypothetical protein
MLRIFPPPSTPSTGQHEYIICESDDTVMVFPLSKKGVAGAMQMPGIRTDHPVFAAFKKAVLQSLSL